MLLKTIKERSLNLWLQDAFIKCYELLLYTIKLIKIQWVFNETGKHVIATIIANNSVITNKIYTKSVLENSSGIVLQR